VNDLNTSDAEFDALPSATKERAVLRVEHEHADYSPAEGRGKLGVVIGGSLSEGLEVKLDRDVSLEELAVGRYVVARGRRHL